MSHTLMIRVPRSREEHVPHSCDLMHSSILIFEKQSNKYEKKATTSAALVVVFFQK